MRKMFFRTTVTLFWLMGMYMLNAQNLVIKAQSTSTATNDALQAVSSTASSFWDGFPASDSPCYIIFGLLALIYISLAASLLSGKRSAAEKTDLN